MEDISWVWWSDGTDHKRRTLAMPDSGCCGCTVDIPMGGRHHIPTVWPVKLFQYLISVSFDAKSTGAKLQCPNYRRFIIFHFIFQLAISVCVDMSPIRFNMRSLVNNSLKYASGWRGRAGQPMLPIFFNMCSALRRHSSCQNSTNCEHHKPPTACSKCCRLDRRTGRVSVTEGARDPTYVTRNGMVDSSHKVQQSHFALRAGAQSAERQDLSQHVMSSHSETKLLEDPDRLR
jgi:hypothetical protein